MQPEWLNDILNRIIYFLENVPEGRKFLEDTDNIDVEQFLSALIELFKIEDGAIKRESKKKFATDNYENDVRYFAKQLIICMIPNHNQLKSYSNYEILLGQRHVAYGFYSILNSMDNEHDPKEKGLYNDVLKDPSIEKVLYLGLVNFYYNFFGSFSDNEEAITLLCKFCPMLDRIENNTEEIVKALFRHISLAGTPSDSGYAYNGIALIKKNIGKLPIEIIRILLQQYQLYRIINDKVYRHQIFTVIQNSEMTLNEKEKLKFTYLDSLILANQMNKNLYEEYGQNDNLSRNNLFFDYNLAIEKIGLIRDDSKDNIYAYWTNGNSERRSFVVNEKELFSIGLNITEKKILIEYSDSSSASKEFRFTYEDWMLDNYRSEEVEQKLQDFLFKNNSVDARFNYNRLTFSLLYLSCFRGGSEHLVDFDHQFIYNTESNELKDLTNYSVIPHFYGKKIHSLSCIVGKNGTGKTSTVDFLRDTFFRLLYLVSEKIVDSPNGYISEVEYKDFEIMDENCKFFVVFHLGNNPYYLTNIKDATVSSAKPHGFSAYKSDNELSKVIYFSNILNTNRDDLFTDTEKTTRDNNEEKGKGKLKKEELAQSLNNFRQLDYSEATSFIYKRKALEIVKPKKNKNAKEDSNREIVNKDLCYQLAFLDYLNKEKLKYYFDMPEDKLFILKSDSLGIEGKLLTVEYSFNEMLGEESLNLKSFLTAPDAKLEFFSSGQYAKFSFLSKLYWLLEGYQKYIENFESIIGINVFSRDEALLEGDTALLFIDEGEVYYHPEWQRNYVKTLVDFIHNTRADLKLQVVLTTNSPFIISDILHEDITYLSKEEKNFDLTFGQNIHKLLKDNFFMTYTIGEFSREVIVNITRWLSDEYSEVNITEELRRYFGKEIKPTDYYENISLLINRIGEPIYREKLLDMLNKKKWARGEILKAQLLEQRDEIDRKIKELEGGQV